CRCLPGRCQKPWSKEYSIDPYAHLYLKFVTPNAPQRASAQKIRFADTSGAATRLQRRCYQCHRSKRSRYPDYESGYPGDVQSAVDVAPADRKDLRDGGYRQAQATIVEYWQEVELNCSIGDINLVWLVWAKTKACKSKCEGKITLEK